MKRLSDDTLRAIVRLGLLNFYLFFVAALFLGGTAIGGTAFGGHFYLSDHGRLTEVSELVWLYSRVHTLTTVFSFPAVALADFLLWPRSRKGKWSNRGRGAL